MLWDIADPSVFCVADRHHLYSFLHAHCGVNGPSVTALGEASLDAATGDLSVRQVPTPLTDEALPILLFDGTVVCQQPHGSLVNVRLHSHDTLNRAASLEDKEGMAQSFHQALALSRFDAAFKVAGQLHRLEAWQAIGRRALQCQTFNNNLSKTI